MQRFPLLEPDFLRFCGRMVLRIPATLWEASKGWTTLSGVAALYLALSPKLQEWGLSLFGSISPLWALVPVGLLFLLGLMRAPFEEYQRLRSEKEALEQERETDEKRADVAAELQQLYRRGLDLRAGVMNSDDEFPASEWQEKFVGWRQDVFGYLHTNVSVGKAEYVDGVTSVSAATIMGMKSSATRDEKETIVLHLQERLNRLAEVMREY